MLIENLTQRDIILTLRPGEIAMPGHPAKRSVNVTIGPSSGDLIRDRTGRAPNLVDIGKVCVANGLDAKDVEATLRKDLFLAQMAERGDLRIH
jgi:hypothetical protein